jgi:hypothetical protein
VDAISMAPVKIVFSLPGQIKHDDSSPLFFLVTRNDTNEGIPGDL